MVCALSADLRRHRKMKPRTIRFAVRAIIAVTVALLGNALPYRRKGANNSVHYKKLLLCFALLTCALRPTLLGQSSLSDSSELHVHRMPLVFEPNRGQAPANIAFLARGGDYSIFLQSNRTMLVLPTLVNGAKRDQRSQSLFVTLQLLHANGEARAEVMDPLPGKSNYFIGKRSANWKTGIPQYGKVAFKSIYPGIDLVYYGTGGQLEYDFVLSPGADPHCLSFRVTGAENIELSASGDLLMHIPPETIELRRPTIYQEDINGIKRKISG